MHVNQYPRTRHIIAAQEVLATATNYCHDYKV